MKEEWQFVCEKHIAEESLQGFAPVFLTKEPCEICGEPTRHARLRQYLFGRPIVFARRGFAALPEAQ